jgi:hypothetical protein
LSHNGYTKGIVNGFQSKNRKTTDQEAWGFHRDLPPREPDDCGGLDLELERGRASRACFATGSSWSETKASAEGGEMSTTTRDTPWRVSEETQRAILELAAVVKDVGLIARALKVNRQTVQVIVEHGVVCTRPLREPRRCGGCGAMIVIAPCLGCEMLRRENLKKETVSV